MDDGIHKWVVKGAEEVREKAVQVAQKVIVSRRIGSLHITRIA
jgi:hypothetical protein